MNKHFNWLASLSLVSVVAACAGPQAPPPAAVSQAPPPTPAPVSQVAAKPADESLTIDFDTAGTALSSEANSQLDGAARLYRDAKPEVMIIAGHSDKSGEEFPNLILSAHRAELVKQALVDRGIPAERLQIVAYGEAEPVANTSPSRSAVVTWR